MTVELNRIYCGDALEELRTFPAESVNCIITSPPYYGLRDYGVAGQIGLENSPEKYVERLMAVLMECRRVLMGDGTMWLIIGDSYAGSGRGKGDINRKGIQQKASFVGDMFDKPYRLNGYKNKDLLGIPWALAFALRSEGWYIRQDIIWHKPNPMPESVRDRCTKAHEYLFLFTKSARYYFDHNAMLEPANYDGRRKITHNGSAKYLNGMAVNQKIFNSGHERWPTKLGNGITELPVRNRRSVWTVPTKGFKGAHFATFPPALIRTCIESGCPYGGVVLDPFMGAGTTALVSRELGRSYVGIELNGEYIKMAETRLNYMENK
jgi:DNA modification methylase